MENVINWFSMVSFIASIASLILALVAIWVAFYFKNQADQVSEKVADLLLEIKSDAKSISQVAMPELKAYGDSMRRFILKGDSINEESAADSTILSKLDGIDRQIKSLSEENDINKLKTKLSLVSKEIENSEANIVQRMTKHSKEGRSGVRINFGSKSSIETSSPSESWQFLLKAAMSWGNRNYRREEYGEKWLLIDKSKDSALPKKYITDETVTFEEAGLSIGDDLALLSL